MNNRSNTGLLPPSPSAIEQLIAIVGRDHALTDPQDQAPYLREWRGRYVGSTPLVLRPGSVAEISAILEIANREHFAIVTQGGNTGLVGGQIPAETGFEIILTTNRLHRIRDTDADAGHMTVEAGVTLAEVQAQAAAVDRLFPLSLASEGTCTIGGNLATNAGGVAVLAYGSARQLVLGLEVVLADGRVWDGLRALKKDNTGYDLKQLFIGSEGTLGIITAAVLKLFPAPTAKSTAFVALPRLDAALQFFRAAERSAGHNLTAFEFISRESLDVVLRHVEGARTPFSELTQPWYVLIEISSTAEVGEPDELMQPLLEEALDKEMIADAVLASSMSQSGDLWRLRETLSEAQRFEGGSIKHDISVPVGRIPEFVAHAAPIVENICPGSRPIVFGHFGDGNIHYNVSQPVEMDKAAYLKLWEPMNEAVHTLVTELGGSISAEHGIGRMKREALTHFRSQVELDLMRQLKQTFDPQGILNPGKLI